MDTIIIYRICDAEDDYKPFPPNLEKRYKVYKEGLSVEVENVIESLGIDRALSTNFYHMDGEVVSEFSKILLMLGIGVDITSISWNNYVKMAIKANYPHWQSN
jgi:hypothetical protein